MSGKGKQDKPKTQSQGQSKSKGGKSGNKNKGGVSSDVLKKKSKTELAGLTFPVARIRRYMKQGGYSSRVTMGASVFLAGILEYLAVELIELSGNAAKENKQRRIKPRYIRLAISADEELQALLQHVTIRDGGVPPMIHEALTMRKGKNKGGKDGKDGKSGKGKGSQLSESQEF